jgi:hypothetical protein
MVSGSNFNSQITNDAMVAIQHAIEAVHVCIDIYIIVLFLH